MNDHTYFVIVATECYYIQGEGDEERTVVYDGKYWSEDPEHALKYSRKESAEWDMSQIPQTYPIFDFRILKVTTTYSALA